MDTKTIRADIEQTATDLSACAQSFYDSRGNRAMMADYAKEADDIFAILFEQYTLMRTAMAAEIGAASAAETYCA